MRTYRKFRNLGKSGKIGKFGNPQKRRYVPRWTQIIMEQRASGLSGMAYCRRAEINCKTFYYWQNVIQKELLASKAQYTDVVETLSPSSEPIKPSKGEHETSTPKTPAIPEEVALRRSSHLLNQLQHCPSHPNPHCKKGFTSFH
ncbi:hypothetical protein DWX75_11445 [Mitsuokella sp. AF21-1AC]|nr:hypothetical protein DWX75_11445 [Mitsuokella sp. AF21-1AC]